MLNTPFAIAMVANMSQYARYIKANIGYIRFQRGSLVLEIW
jgi:hypothetical protein